ncbi:hypothetical protein B6C98_01310 [Gilliamella apis]|nr:hypothetical protein B6C98_01310 [Gilliamella apis]OTQ64590.1 hypothetical protein B6D09_05590 [Gilliamella apis]OTQ67925.1 hypothetical protein B6C89_03280 [Gilliamella apis]OTQ69363.1 hypothetical protein B6D10_04450 [Gilliamella apis]
MRKLIGFTVLVMLLTGCASHKMQSIYQTPGVEIAQNPVGVDIINIVLLVLSLFFILHYQFVLLKNLITAQWF